MKKRRLCKSIKKRSSKRNLPRSPNLSNSESFPSKARNSAEFKSHHCQRGAANKPLPPVGDHGDEAIIEKNVFSSLESLFDVKTPIFFPDAIFVDSECQISTDFIKKLEAHTPRSPKSFVHTLYSSHRSPKFNFKPSTLEKSASVFEQVETLVELKSERRIKNITKMAELKEEGDIGSEAEIEGEMEAQDQMEEQESKAKLNVDEDFENEEEIAAGYKADILEGNGGFENGIISASPLTDTAVIKEMKAADDRCTIIAKEIAQLKRELAELTEKEDLTQEDTIAIQEKQEDVMTKLGEFEAITRKLQRLLGLSDPSSYTFAKMFGMLTYPHENNLTTMDDNVPCDEIDDDYDAQVQRSLKKWKEVSEKFRFDLPQTEYPEDQLPRVIVCGDTEDNIPKIVVPDSSRRGKKKCLQAITGKLSESLKAQERLLRENAHLEGGKYKLEEALLEKDSAVESLQRKVCGLQAEMRIVVQENTELSRQLACLSQRISGPSGCSSPPPGVVQSSSPLQDYSTSPTLQEDYNCCVCEHCTSGATAGLGDTTAKRTICVSPEEFYAGLGNDSPRLAGGASDRSFNNHSAEEYSHRSDMLGRNPASPPCAPTCSPPTPRGTCPAELENKLATYHTSTKQLEHQLGNMESEVRNMQLELASVQRERQQLEQQRKLLKCTGPCAPCACSPPSPTSGGFMPGSPMVSQPPAPPSLSIPLPKQQGAPTCSGPCLNAPMGTSTCPQIQLRDLREQYARLQDDYKNKLLEVSCLRADAEKLKMENREAREDKETLEIQLVDARERLKVFESEQAKFDGNKEQLMEQEQALIVAKQRFNEAQDELEELRSLVQEQAAQLEDYRNKYLQAQEMVEEQRRQLDLMEMDNARMNENVTLEIGRVKCQFQEKLAELAPLPDILKQSQMKLQEAQQMRMVAERQCEELARELLGCKDKIQTLQNQMEALQAEMVNFLSDKGSGSARIDELELKNGELRRENERMRVTLARFEEHESQLQKRMDEKMHEVTQLNAMLEQVREDSARQVARTKERSDTIRRSMQNQITEMERQLAACRATAKAAQKDRDEIREKMQGQINNLNDAFDQAQGRIKSLQGHVNYLKTSYSNIFKGQGEVGAIPTEAGVGYDSCDCNY
ncbi:myosin-11-like [Prorops nasuta]|uniref:myosin-11-like n=1 Tax=Prorops nasuta TaxID=863751 RepID=UPI0034CF753B